MWLAVLLAIPVLLWLWIELFHSGHAPAGLVLLAALACSPFVAETLTLPHSAVGFYLVGAWLALAFAVYALLGRSRSRPLFWTRVVAGGAVFAICALCRSGTILMLPALLLAVWLAARRVHPGTVAHVWPTASREWGLLLVALLAFCTPYLILRPKERHAYWIAFWEGLADYGESRGYSWHDRDAKRFLLAHGVEPFDHP